ncbi:MAG: hypothetical protein OXI91_04820 [Chloroflexota bacterium]|nr:hypothetical protein [Chloroflexota bacterium]
MRQTELFSDLQRALSGNRLEPYLSQSTQRDTDVALATYLWNLALCESLYPSLHGIEVSLRNSIHDTASRKFGNEFWFTSHLVGREKENIEKIGQGFSRRNIEATPGKYVSECNFGFWVSLFKSEYELTLWRILTGDVFPYAPRQARTRSLLRARLDGIRRLRNRVFHFEPIWQLPDLSQQHIEILETIGWINPTFREMTETVDRFPQVFDDGPAAYQARLNTLGQLPQSESETAMPSRGNENE